MSENKFTLQDCPSCHFLGHYKDHDLYFCTNELTIIQRYGNENHEYTSGIIFALSPNPKDVVRECLIRALLISQYKQQISNHIEKYSENLSYIKQFKERLAEANERLLLESYNDRDLPLLINSLIFESNKIILTQRVKIYQLMKESPKE